MSEIKNCLECPKDKTCSSWYGGSMCTEAPGRRRTMNLHKCLLTRNDCYKAGRTIVPHGVMVHSTGANNPKVSRYVPGDSVVGRNTAGNHWDQTRVYHYTDGTKTVGVRDTSKKLERTDYGSCVHAFVGRFADGSVGTAQTLPWTMRGWHCGKGSRGSGNDTHISFEICEDGLTDASYFKAVYREAVELTAMLCKEYDLDPLADGVVICHAEGHKRGVASNHADVLHWFPKHGKTREDFRADVAREMKGESDLTEKEVRAIVRDEYVKIESERVEQPVSAWAAALLEEAKAKGITDGSRPQSYATRQEVALMVNAVK